MSIGFAKTWATGLVVLLAASGASASSVAPLRQPALSPPSQGAESSKASASPRKGPQNPDAASATDGAGDEKESSASQPATRANSVSTQSVELQKQRVREAEARVKKLERDLKAERSKGDRQSARIGQLKNDIGEAERVLRKASAAVKEAGAQIADANTEIESARKKNEDFKLQNIFLEQYRNYVIVAAIFLVALGVLLVTILLRRARERSSALRDDLDQQAKLEQTRKNAADWVLVGSKNRLKLRGMLLADAGRGSIVGRGQSDADVIVDDKDESVSRRHARFFYRDGNLLLEDLRSLNGTFINGRRLDSGEIREVREHDQISIAKFNYTLRRA